MCTKYFEIQQVKFSVTFIIFMSDQIYSVIFLKNRYYTLYESKINIFMVIFLFYLSLGNIYIHINL